MSFDFHIADNSPEAHDIEVIVSREHVSPAEALRRALRGMAAGVTAPQSGSNSQRLGGKKPGELLFGLFADEPELMLRIAKDARQARNIEIVKDLSA